MDVFVKKNMRAGYFQFLTKGKKKGHKKDFRVCGRFDKWDYNWTKKSWEQGIFIFFIKKIFFLKKGPKRRILGGASFGVGHDFLKKKRPMGGCIFAFWKKSSRQGGDVWVIFFSYFKWYFEKKWSIIGANDKNPLEDRVFSGGGGAFWPKSGGGGVFWPIFQEFKVIF